MLRKKKRMNLWEGAMKFAGRGQWIRGIQLISLGETRLPFKTTYFLIRDGIFSWPS